MKHEKRNMDRLRAEMATLALADPSNLAPPVVGAEQATIGSSSRDIPAVDLENPGLTRMQLEDQRWKVSAPVAEATFMRLGLLLDPIPFLEQQIRPAIMPSKQSCTPARNVFAAICADNAEVSRQCQL